MDGTIAGHESLGPPLRYTVTMEPHERNWLFAVDMPLIVPEGAYLTTDYQLLSRRVVRERRATKWHLRRGIASA